MEEKVVKKLLYLIKEYKRMEKANEYAPFPVYDTDDLKRFKKRITKMEAGLEKVECCTECKSLFLIEDDFGNTWCGKCNTPNSTETCDNIDEYLDKYGDIWT